jgi:SAM-dependent methyltransferase
MMEDLSLGKYMTFESSKQKPVHRWFYYKEGYSPEIVEYALKQEKAGGRLIDPFCGTGTSLLAAKENNLESRGVDASELAVFVSRVKCANYEKKNIGQAKEFLKNLFKERREPELKWDFELFSPKAAFPKRNLNDILYIREAIEKSEYSEKTANLLLLALVSTLPQSSIVIKDGGVLKIDKRKRAMPAKDAFKRKVKRMVSDIEKAGIRGKEPDVQLGDARELYFKDGSCDIIVTSPPYLNNIDYSKVYGLELSLLTLDKETTKMTRNRSLRSFLQRGTKPAYVPPEVEEMGRRIPVVGAYFADMENSISEMKRVLKTGSSAYVVVSNSVIFREHVFVDEILAAIGERLNLESEIIVGGYRIADVKPHKVRTRESMVILRKT